MSRIKKVTICGLIVGGLIASGVVYYLSGQRDQATTKISGQDASKQDRKQEKSLEHNYQNVDFAKKMILVDQQAMQIAEMGSQKMADIKIKELATKIYASSESNSQAYTSLLDEWNEEHLNLSDFPEMEGHDMYPTFPGMIKLSEIQRLKDLSGSSFEKSFLELMNTHHKEVIEMQAENGGGNFSGIVALRQEYVSKLKEQMVHMKQLYKEKGYGSLENI